MGEIAIIMSERYQKKWLFVTIFTNKKYCFNPYPMKKLLLIISSLFIYNIGISQSHLKYLDYIFPSDSISGFDVKAADAMALQHYFFGSEYKVFMYKSKRDFINSKYGFTFPSFNQNNKSGPATINAAPCMNEDFELSASTTGTTPATAVANTLVGWTVTQGQNVGVNGSCLQAGCCPIVGSTDCWVRSTPWTAPAPLGAIGASPLGGTKVLQMNDNVWAQGEVVRIQQTFPVTSTNALFQFTYKAAMDGSGHPCCDQPYMRVEIMDCMNNILNCPKVDIIPPGASCATVSPTGWLTSGNISYTPNWIVKSIDLSPYLGSCVTIKVTVGDCDGWAHYGYAFFDAVCKPMTVGVNNLVFPAGTNVIAVAACGVATASLQAPAGMGPYLWNGPGGSGVTSNTNQAVNTTVAGNYTLTMTPPGICAPITKTLSLSFSTYPTVGFTRPNNCTTYTLTNSGTAAPAVQTYSFAGPGAPSSFTTTSPTSVVNFAPSTTYTITQTITNAAGCYTNTSQVITTPAGPSPAFTAVPSLTQCFSGNAFTFNATTAAGTHTYNFSPAAGAPATGNVANYGAVSFTSPGTYTITHTVNSAGCVTATSSVVVVNSTPTIAVATGTAPPCASQSATLNASGGPGTLIWTGPGSYSAVAGGTTTITNFTQGVYTLTANNNGCIATRTVNIVNPSLPVVTFTNTGPYCQGASIVFNATSSSTSAISFTQFWSNSSATGWWSYCCSGLTTTVTTPATTSSSGVYFFYISYANGCYAQLQTTVTVNPCVLPIELSSFSANCINNNSIEVNWETQSEKDTDYFLVKRSTDGINFVTVAKVKAHGNSNSANNYSIIDNDVSGRTSYYYKLVEVDIDKSEREIDKMVSSNCNISGHEIDVYPVPADNELYILSHEDLGNVNIDIVDAFGRTVKSISGTNVTRNGKIKIGTSDLISGCYEIILSSETRITQKRIVIFR